MLYDLFSRFRHFHLRLRVPDADGGQLTHASSTIDTRTYDDGGRMTGSSYGNGVSESRSYNTRTKSTLALISFTGALSLVGDWTSYIENSTTQNRTHGPTHELHSAGGQNLSHDTKGNMTHIPAGLCSGWSAKHR